MRELCDERMWERMRERMGARDGGRGCERRYVSGVASCRSCLVVSYLDILLPTFDTFIPGGAGGDKECLIDE